MKAAGQIFVSGNIPFNAEGQEVGTTITEKTEQICQNISAILKEAGSSMQRVVKVNVRLQFNCLCWEDCLINLYHRSSSRT